MLIVLKAASALAAVIAITYAALGPHGLAWDRPLVSIGLAAIGLGLIARHDHASRGRETAAPTPRQ